MSTKAASGRSLAVIYSTVALDAAGIGFVFPILPRLIQDVTPTRDATPYVGWTAALHAAMQFVFTPGEQRAHRFGLMGAMFGAGFIIGPVLGGVLGAFGIWQTVVQALLQGPRSRTASAPFRMKRSRWGDRLSR